MTLDLALQGVATLTLLVGLWRLGDHRLSGPFLAAIAELMWMAVFVPHRVYGGIVLSVILFAMQARNWWKWRSEGVSW